MDHIELCMICVENSAKWKLTFGSRGIFSPRWLFSQLQLENILLGQINVLLSAENNAVYHSSLVVRVKKIKVEYIKRFTFFHGGDPYTGCYLVIACLLSSLF